MGIFQPSRADIEDGMAYKLGRGSGVDSTPNNPPYRLSSLALSSPPADLFDNEPCTLQVLKDYLHVTHTSEDTQIKGFAMAARSYIESYLAKAIVPTHLRMWMDRVPGPIIELPYPPLVSVDAITTYDPAGTGTVFTSTKYNVDADGVPGRVYLDDTEVWPTGLRRYQAFKLDFVCGYVTPSTQCPDLIKEGIKRMTAILYERRGDQQDYSTKLPAEVQAFLVSERQIKL